MHKQEQAEVAGWQANLELSFARRETRTLLTGKSHCGPLQIQKALYPEGPETCHVTVLHPPGGIAQGDSLTVAARLDPRSRVCLTTPGATKWYRCPQGTARQQLRFSVAEGAMLEWLPRENILFNASTVRMSLDVDLARGAQFLGWEILCFGRRAFGEAWDSGGLTLRSNIRQSNHLLWAEHANIRAGNGFEASPMGLAGFTVSATLVAAGSDVDAASLAQCRSITPSQHDSRVGITTLPGMLVARYLGHASQDAFNWLTAAWKVLRPALQGRAAIAPRIWAC